MQKRLREEELLKRGNDARIDFSSVPDVTFGEDLNEFDDTPSDEQQQCLAQLAPSLQGRTQKQQSPYPPTSLPTATWVIARLGGWSGDRSQRPPGMPKLGGKMQLLLSLPKHFEAEREMCIHNSQL